MIKIILIVVIPVVVGALGVWGSWQYFHPQQSPPQRNYWIQQKAQRDWLLQQQMQKTNKYYGTVAGPQDRVEW